MIDGDLNNGNGVRKKLTEKIRVEEITDKEDCMPLSCNLCMFFNKGISKVWIIFCE